MEQLSVDVADLKNLNFRFGNMISEVDQKRNSVGASGDALRSAFQSGAAKTFSEALRSWDEQMQRVSTTLTEISNSLAQSAGDYSSNLDEMHTMSNQVQSTITNALG